MQTLSKEQVNQLIDTLIKTGGGTNPYAKFSSILKLVLDTDNIRAVRNTLLLWLDTMNILSVDFQSYKYRVCNPTWVLSSIKNRYVLLGALTLDEIDQVKENLSIEEVNNEVTFGGVKYQLPDTYSTESITSEEKSYYGYPILEGPIFSNVLMDDGISNVLEKTIAGELRINEIDNVIGINFYINEFNASVNIFNQDEVQMFDWRIRRFSACNIQAELRDQAGIKLIKIIQKKDGDVGNHIDVYTLLIEKEEGGNWRYTYFDPNVVDERWARYVYLKKNEYVDLHRDLNYNYTAQLMENIRSIEENSQLKKEEDSDINSTKNFKIPSRMLKQLIQYDNRNGILAVPVSIPLPKSFMKYLFSCSGSVPEKYLNKFTINPKYPIKLLYSGAISSNGSSIPFPDEPYFIKEEMYLFTSVPSELADAIFDKLGIYPYKKTFFKNLN